MNYREHTVKKQLEDQGYEVLDRGWPDLLVRHKTTGKIKAVEVKAERDRVKPGQEKMHEVLASVGISTEIVRVPLPKYSPKEEVEIVRRLCKENPGISADTISGTSGIHYNRVWQILKWELRWR